MIRKLPFHSPSFLSTNLPMDVWFLLKCVRLDDSLRLTMAFSWSLLFR